MPFGILHIYDIWHIRTPNAIYFLREKLHLQSTLAVKVVGGSDVKKRQTQKRLLLFLVTNESAHLMSSSLTLTAKKAVRVL